MNIALLEAYARALGFIKVPDIEAAVADAIAELVGSSPSTLDTIYEIAAALNNDPNVVNSLLAFATATTASLATKAPLASPTFTGTVTGTFSGNLTGNVTGNVTGNASTATALQTARTINGTSFDGTANITVTAAAGTLTGTALAAAVVSSSLNAITPSGGTLAITGSGTTNVVTLNVTNMGAGNTFLNGTWAAGGSYKIEDLAGRALHTITNHGGLDFTVAGSSSGTSLYTFGASVSTPRNVFFTITPTWNNVSTAYTGVLVNATDTTSAAATLVADFQVGSASVFNVRKDGGASTAAGFNAGVVNLATAIGQFNSYAGSTQKASLNTARLDLFDAAVITFSSTSSSQGTKDTGIARNAAGVVEVNNGTAGTFRDLKLRNITVSGDLITFAAGSGTAPIIQHASNSVDHKVGTSGLRWLNNAGTVALLSATDGTTTTVSVTGTVAASVAFTATGNLINFGTGSTAPPYIQHASATVDFKQGSSGFRVLNNAATAALLSLTDGTTTVMTLTGRLKITALPTSTSGLSTGDLWNDAGTVKVV